VLTPPAGFGEDLLTAALDACWGLTAATVSYLPVGFGSYHWAVADTAGGRWFVTADDLEFRRFSLAESLDVAFARLRASLATAAGLRERGCGFVVAPVAAAGGDLVIRAGERFAVAVYPFVDGRSFAWGEFAAPGHRLAMLEMISAVHLAPAAGGLPALADDFAIPHRDELEAALAGPGGVTAAGPYAEPTARLLRRRGAPVRALLARYDVLAGQIGPPRTVVTHGEPHPGNAMLSSEGWRLIDWDTALVAPPERDLWFLDQGDGAVLAAYAARTGVRPDPVALELYRIRWDLADIAANVGRFRRPHAGSEDDDKTWRGLVRLIEEAGRTDSVVQDEPAG